MANLEMDGGIKIYLREIARTPLLTREEEFELANRIKLWDKEARVHMIKANLRLVVKIAQDYANYWLPLLDLISEGNMGLMKAVERFDPNKGGKLSTYAAWWIKQSIKRALSNQSKTIRLPVHMNDKIAKMRRVAMTMSEELGREPTDDELSKEIGIEREKFAAMKSYSMRPMSLDAPISDDGPEEFGDIIGDEKALDALQILINKNNHMQLDDLLEVLDERELDIIQQRFGLAGQKPKKLEEVGEKFWITRERVRQIQNKALKKMRRALGRKDDSRFSEDEEDEDSPSSRRSRQLENALERWLIGAGGVVWVKETPWNSHQSYRPRVVIEQRLWQRWDDASWDNPPEIPPERFPQQKIIPTLEERETLENREGEAEKVRAILHMLTNTELAIAKKFWGEKQWDPVISQQQIAGEMSMNHRRNVDYYITKIRKRLAPTSQNNWNQFAASTVVTKHKQDPLIIALYNPNNISQLAENLDMTEDELVRRATMLGMDALCVHINTLEWEVWGWLTNKEFSDKYNISVMWLESGEKASELIHKEALILSKDGADYYNENVVDGRYSWHLRGLLLRAYKKDFPSYRLPDELWEKSEK